MPYVRDASGNYVFQPVLPGKTSTGLTKLPTTTKPAATDKASLFYQQQEKQNLSKLLMSAGLTKEATALTAPPKLSVLQRVGRGLSAFETGDALYAKLYEDKPFLKEYAKDIIQGLGAAVTGREAGTGDPKKTFKDIMMMEGMRDRPGKLDAVDIAGLAGDILTDPTTFLGSTFGKGVIKGVGLTSKALKNAPLIGKAITGVEMTMEGLFKPFAKIEKMGEVGNAYRASFEAFAKGTRSEVDDFVNEIATRATKVKNIPEAGAKIGVGVEEGGGAVLRETSLKSTADQELERLARVASKGVTKANPEEKLLNDAIDELLNTQKELTSKEAERGILKTELQDYMHHMLTPEARDFYNKGGNLTQYLKPIRVKLGAALHRGISSFTDEAGNRIIGKASALGLKPVGKIKGLADDITYGTYKTFSDIEKTLGEYGYKIRFKPQSTVHRTAAGYFSPAKKEIVIAAKQPTMDQVLSIVKHEVTHNAHFEFGGILQMVETITGKGKYKVLKQSLDTLKDAAKAEKEGIWKAIGINWKELSPAKKQYYSEPTELLAYGMEHSQKDPALAQELFPQTYELLQEIKKKHPLFGLTNSTIDESVDFNIKNLYQDKTGKLFKADVASVKEINNTFREKLGFDLFEANAFKAFAKRGVDSIRAVKTYDFLKNTAATFGKKVKNDFIDEQGMKWIQSGAKQLEGIRLPEPIAKHIDEVNKILSNDEATNQFLKAFDTVQTFWKGTVTGWFPSFHTRNALGGVFNNWLAGLYDPRVYMSAEDILKGGAGKIITKTGKEITYDTIRKEIKDFGVTGQTGFLDVVEHLQKNVDPTLAQKLSTAPQKVMGAIENRLRVPLFIDGLKRGMTSEQAAKRVIKFHFDYMPEGFTAFERHVMKRLIPFYTWTRNNIPLQIEQLIMQPGKFAGIFKAQRSFGQTPGTEEESVLPRWLREQFTIKGEGGYWSGMGLPFEELTQAASQPLRKVGMSISPMIKTPLEVLTNYNIFKEKNISDDTYAKNYRNAPDWLKSWLQIRENTSKDGQKYYTANPHRKYWLELIGARGLTTALRISNSAEDRKNLWSLIIPMRKYDFDPEDLKMYAERDKVENARKALLNTGLIKKFDVFYTPKK